MTNRTLWLALASLVGWVACKGDKVPLGGGVPFDGGTVGVVVPGLDGGFATALPPAPAIQNIVGIQREDSIGIDFDPVEGAKDYRIYPLPADSDITAYTDGSIVVKNAVYRCAGLRQTYDLPNNTINDREHPNDDQVYINGQYSWEAEIPSQPLLGHVYVTPGADRAPVYAVGVHTAGNEAGWRESRAKIYTTDTTQRAALIAAGGRDDGIVFYVPAAASSATQTMYHSGTAMEVAGQGWTQYSEYYFLAAELPMHDSDDTAPSAAFEILNAAAADTQPLYAVFYRNDQRHTELAVGTERFTRASNQGQGPLWHLEWSGLTQPTVLVVEALDAGCPFQGLLSPAHLDAPPHQTFYTLDELHARSTTGEVFVNGQFFGPGESGDGLPILQHGSASPRVLARSYVFATPQPHVAAEWDWYEGFTAPQIFTEDGEGIPPTDKWSQHFTGTTLDFGGYSLDNPNDVFVLRHGLMFGQLWSIFDDTGQDVTGTMRMTALQNATIDSDANAYLHLTWSVNIVGTGRRYPQLILTDQPRPVMANMANDNANVLLLQTILGPSMRFEMQAFHGPVNGKPWAVNNQADEHRIVDHDKWNDGSNNQAAPPPSQPLFEHAGMDRMTRFDAYVSNARVYLFVDGAPVGCARYPNNGFALSGPVTVTFGDVIYHEGAEDEGVCSQRRPYAFLHEHQCMETIRHWDDLGFKSGVGAPSWDETRFPCEAY